MRQAMKVKVRQCAVASSLLALACAARPAPCPDAPPLEPSEAAASPTGPRARAHGTVYAWTFGEHELVVDPSDGGRTVVFALGGKNVLRERKDSPEAYGSSFWTSPQSDWNWPPPLELASKPWATRVEGEALVLTSDVSPELGVDVVQRIRVEHERGSVVFEYTVRNRSDRVGKFAPWQNTRVAPSGLTFYPSGGPLSPHSTLSLDASAEVVFFRHDPARFDQGAKAFGDGREGWLAHVDGDLLFVKVFPDVPPEQQAPKEAEIELYVDGNGRFVEVEQQGPYRELVAGASMKWVVRWYLRKLPPSVEAAAGSEALVRLVRETIR